MTDNSKNTNKLNYNSELINDFYLNIQQKTDKANEIYPDIECKTGCNRCCKFYGSPEVFDFEWENIKNYIESNFSEKEIKRIEKKLLNGFINSEEYFLSNSDDNLNPETFFECPFIYKNQCSIYSQRPFICRAFGNSKLNDKILTCSEELNRWENKDFSLLPDKEDLEKHSITVNAQYKTIIYWLSKYFNIKKEEI